MIWTVVMAAFYHLTLFRLLRNTVPDHVIAWKPTIHQASLLFHMCLLEINLAKNLLNVTHVVSNRTITYRTQTHGIIVDYLTRMGQGREGKTTGTPEPSSQLGLTLMSSFFQVNQPLFPAVPQSHQLLPVLHPRQRHQQMKVSKSPWAGGYCLCTDQVLFKFFTNSGDL